MKVKQGFLLRQMADQYVVVAVGDAMKEFQGMIRLNHTGAFIWKRLAAQTNEREIIQDLLNEYDAEESKVAEDVRTLIAQLRDIGALDE